MDDIKSKLEDLRNDCITQAKNEANEMNNNIDMKIENDIKEQIEEYSKKQEVRFNREIKNLEKQYNTKRYELEKEVKMNLLEMQKEVKMDLINTVEENMKIFVQSEEYLNYLIKNINNSLSKIGKKGDNIIIYITNYDSGRYSKILSANFNEYNIETISDDNIGGSKCLDKSSNIIIDNTIRLLIRERIEEIY